MQIKGKIPLLIVAVLAWIVIISSCANPGMPMGGPRDSVPPVLLETSPLYKELNYDGDEVRLTFDEFIIPDGVSELLVVSPPLEKRPTIRTKGKSLVVQFNEELKDSTTYSLDFKNSITDNNEKNPYYNLRFSFSTGDIYDSLRVAGKVMNAFNLEPNESSLVLLQKNLHDSAVFSVTPDFIAKTDEEGLFMIDNIAPGSYNIFSFTDLNNDLLYNEGAEEIAFWDSIVVPSAEYHEELDTLSKGVDSLMIVGHTHFSPDPIYLRIFMEDIFEQYLETSERETRYKCNFIFNESVKDTFTLRLLDYEVDDWYILEDNPGMDSLSIWIKDTTIARNDTLFMELGYYQLDTTAQLYVQKDTLEMTFKDRVQEKKKKRRSRSGEEEEEKPEPVPQFDIRAGAGSTVELNQKISLLVPEPVEYFDSSMLRIYLTEDTLMTPLPIKFSKDTAAWRTYMIEHEWEPEMAYTLEIDSAACTNIYGVTNKTLSKRFKTREEDYYGIIKVNLASVKGPMIVQLLENSDDEKVVSQLLADEDGTVTFTYVAPGKYKLKLIYDENDNGKWDIGSYQDKLQPEKVAYYNEVLKVRSNWDTEILWDYQKVDLTYSKNIRDRELEEKLRKEAEEKARMERENPERPQMQNENMFQGGGSSGLIRR